MTAPDLVLSCGEWTARFGATGTIQALTNGMTAFVASSDASRELVVEVGGRPFPLSEPELIRREPDHLLVRYLLDGDGDAPALAVELEHRLLPLLRTGLAVETVVTLRPTARIDRDVCVRLPAQVSVGENCELFAPRKNGVAYIGRGGPIAGHFAWELAGKARMFLGGHVDALGLPLVSERGTSAPWRLTWCADPYFTTSFQLATRSLQDPPARELNWCYSGAVGMAAPEQRRVYACLHEGDEATAIEAWYATALAHIPPGPAWLHDISLIHYDYLSKAGHGWFQDVDTLAHRIPASDRHRVCLCLHGWYDRLGSYSMDAQQGAIMPTWRLERSHDLSGQAGLEMSRERLVAMLRYVRDRGFRATLYYGDGLVANAEWAAQTLPASAVLRCVGWDEGASHSVLLNPLHPRVREWFCQYTRALTEAFGGDTDGFVWDETHYTPIGEIGPAECPGYVDRAFMTLTQQIAGIVHAYRSDLAFLCSDDVGVVHYCDGTGRAGAAYSLVADGCWQDSACSPEAWGFGIFPNHRNVMWSCNWWPVGNFEATKYGAENFGTPAVTSNGYGENRGLAEYPDGTLDKILDLFWDRARSRPLWLPEGDPRIPGPIGTHPIATDLASATGG